LDRLTIKNTVVIPAKAGIHFDLAAFEERTVQWMRWHAMQLDPGMKSKVDSRFRGNDGKT